MSWADRMTRSVAELKVAPLSAREDEVMRWLSEGKSNEEIGIIALELYGDGDVIEAAVAWLREQGVTVEPIEKNVIE